MQVHPIGNFYTLREVLKVRTELQELDPGKKYCMPRINSNTNTITIRGEPKLGANIKKKTKIFAFPGDLIIGTLHTHRDQGLFGFADREYIATSQIVAEVDISKVSPVYLRVALRQILPRLYDLIISDLVGRENYTEDQILDLRIPVPSTAEKSMAKSIAHHEQKIVNQIEQLNQSIKSRFTR